MCVKCVRFEASAAPLWRQNKKNLSAHKFQRTRERCEICGAMFAWFVNGHNVECSQHRPVYGAERAPAVMLVVLKVFIMYAGL